ncbi:hypothetical protein BDA96_02G123700 [Sorghum bicolor]|uniref:Uncharacterized protein n=1 Tax=Sorghum bicolor TaxID=4558 RepID=A0A921RM16_SORBI|nr:hypothetical protein BDA96_02G123700 [Sorghum bicolor]
MRVRILLTPRARIQQLTRTPFALGFLCFPAGGSSVFQRAARRRRAASSASWGRVWVFTRGATSSHARTDARGSGSSRSDFVDSRLGLHARGRVISRAARGRTRGAAGLHARTSSTRGSRPTCTCVARAPVFTRAQAAICRPTSCCPLGNVPLARGLSTATDFILCFHSDHLRQHPVTVVTNFLTYMASWA